jgi:hypothetical protein
MKRSHILNLDIYYALNCDNGITFDIAVSDILSIKNTEMSRQGILYLGDSQDDQQSEKFP